MEDNKGSIDYVYDATGNKLKKVVHETGKPDKTTLYLFGTYENDVLQFLPMEEGRIRPVRDANGAITSFTYDYFVKDHLGNVRMVLTEQKDQHNYIATMETGARTQENQLFDNLDVSQYSAGTAGFPGGGAEDPNETVAHVNGNTQTKGPGIVLKVMAGDVVDIGVRSLYHDQPGTQPTTNLINDILSSLAGGIVSTSGVAKGTVAELSDPVNSPLLGALTGFRQDNDHDIPNKPKAYLNWILVDEQFKYVNTFPQSGAMPVGTAETVAALGQSGINITKNGYLYIYVSNETENWDVFFDDLAVTHHTGPLLEETHYYPFGLTMAGISSKAMTDIAENKHKFNGIEEMLDLGINQYDAFFRNLDPQLGRWRQIDPKPSLNTSPYSAMSNNPILYSDFLGDTTWVYNTNGAYLGVVNDKLKNQVHFMSNGNNNNAAPFDASKLTAKEAKQLAREFRMNSVAFIGSSTMADMKRIVDKAEALNNGKGVELGFVGIVSDTKEIRLNELPPDQGSKNDYDLHAALKEKYQPEEQKGLFLWGACSPFKS